MEINRRYKLNLWQHPEDPITVRLVVAYGNNTGVVIWAGTRDIIYTTDGGVTWTEVADALPSTGYTGLAFGANRWVAVKSGSTEVAFSNRCCGVGQQMLAHPRNWGP